METPQIPESPQQPGSTEPKPGTGTKLRAGLLLLALAVTLLFSLHPAVRHHFDPEGLQAWVGSMGRWSLLIYFGALILGEILWMPRMVLITAGGLLFSPLWAGAISLAADLLAGAAFYLAARTLARPYVEALLTRSARMQRALKLVSENHGTLAVALLRICPLAHYTAFSYACGLWGVRFQSYLLGTALGVLPGALLYPFFGAAVMDPGSPVFWMAAAGLVFFLVGTLWMGRRLFGAPADLGDKKTATRG